MPKKLVISFLLLMLIASIYGYFKLSQYSQEPTSTQQSPAKQIFSIKNIKKQFDRIIKDQKASTMEAEISAVKNNPVVPDNNESKLLAPLEILGTITNHDGQALADVLIYGKGQFPPTHTDSNGQFHIVFEQSGFVDLLLNLSLNGYKNQKNIITINQFEKSPILDWDATLVAEADTQSTTSFGGRVSNLVGEGLANQRIRLITLGDASDRAIRSIEVALTDKNGYFTLNGISINTNYKLIVLAADEYARYEVDDFLVTNDTLDLDIILEYLKLTNKSGLVIDREGVPLPNLKISANNIANDKYSKKLVTNNSGGFQLENFPEGEVSFSIKSPAKIEISGINLSEMDSQTIILMVDIGNHFLSGLVSDSNGQTIENASATMQSTYSKNGVNSHSMRSVITDSKGAFAFESFGADEHIIIIIGKGFNQHMIVYQPHSSDTNLNIILERL